MSKKKRDKSAGVDQEERAEFYYDSFHGRKWEYLSENKIKEEDVVAYIKKNWLDPSDAILEDLNQRNAIRPYAERYLDGETFLATDTAAARNAFRKIINEKLLPKAQQRRVLDAISIRVKDVLKMLAMRIAIERVASEHPEWEDSVIAAEIYERVAIQKMYHCPCPNSQMVGNARRQMKKNGGKLPKMTVDPETKFSLSRVDKQLSSFQREGKDAILSLRMNRKKAVFKFHLPDNPRYQQGDLCKPDIVRTPGGGIGFDIAVKHPAPPLAYEPQCTLGCDVGVVYPVVCALVGDDWYSQAMYPNQKLLDLVDKLHDLEFQKSIVNMKIEQNSAEGRTPARWQHRSFEEIVKVLEREKDGLAGQITDLKGEIARQCAHFVCETAMAHKAQLSFEELNWSEPSHAFFKSMILERVRNLAIVSGIPLVIVSAANTSKKCHRHGDELIQNVKSGLPSTPAPSKKRNSWRHVDSKSGVRDLRLRTGVAGKLSPEVSDEKCDVTQVPLTAVHKVSFSDVFARYNALHEGGTAHRGATCRIEGERCDHDAVGALNVGCSGEVRRGSRVSCFDLAHSNFVRVRRKPVGFTFGWAGLLTVTAAVSASAPVDGSAIDPTSSVEKVATGIKLEPASVGEGGTPVASPLNCCEDH